ncbi:type II toxin-antitoxin system RelE/ParE family toxin [Rhizobium sp. EC-SD404]|uniref:type II toxin-antitoxin system RelE/ParE family toxin n=1 Tax=Rhizobium sp. EC-SD404 TaxID=2038389 RepID=UPI00125F2A31|nr:type II toxin-antitoxin system RelE/ParE family toxin [Rhizobium sp. EC-SD404]
MRSSRKLVVSPTARADLVSIHRYIAEDSPAAADRFIDQLGAKLDAIASSRSSGVPRDWLAPALRASIHGRYAIYFLVEPTEVLIVRILHGARDIGPEDFASTDS